MKKIIIANLKMNLGIKNGLKLFTDYQKYFNNFTTQVFTFIYLTGIFYLVDNKKPRRSGQLRGLHIAR